MSNPSKGSKKPFLLMVLAFVIPVIIAKLALDNDWFNRGATNKGQLLDPILEGALLVSEREPKWRLLYVLPQDCEASCDNALYSIQQVWIALGKESDRVEPVVLNTHGESADVLQLQQDHPYLVVLNINQQSVNQVFKDVPSDGIFLMDTLGNVILRYSLQQEKQQAVLSSRDILADVRKLLKLSRIG